MRRAFLLVSLTAAATLGAGCFIFTGSTDGYSPTDAGHASIENEACAPDATCLGLSCLGNGDCDGGEVCCLGSSSGTVSSACQTGPCEGPQFCKTSDECGGQVCTAQACSVGQVTLTLQACGSIPGCAQ